MKILISGAGIAGMTAANFLHAKGHEIIVIDKRREKHRVFSSSKCNEIFCKELSA